MRPRSTRCCATAVPRPPARPSATSRSSGRSSSGATRSTSRACGTRRAPGPAAPERSARTLVRPGPVAQAGRDEPLAHDVAREEPELAELPAEPVRALGHVGRQRPVAPHVPPRPRRHDRAQERQRHADRRERVVHEHPPAGRDPRAPAHEVRPCRAEPVRAVHEQQVDRAVERPQRQRREVAHVAHALGDAGALEVAAERDRVLLAERRPGGDLARPTVRADVGVDAHELDPGPRPAREHDRRAAAEGADLDYPATVRHGGGRAEQAPRLGLGQPALDVAGGGPGLGEAHVTSAARARRARRPSASTDEATTHWTPNTIPANPTTPSDVAESSTGSHRATTPSTQRNRVSPSATMYWTVRYATASSVIAAPRKISAPAASVRSGPNASRSSSFGAAAKISSAGAAIATRIASARSSTGRGSRPAADRRVASGSRCRPMPIATQTTDFAATAAAA